MRALVVVDDQWQVRVVVNDGEAVGDVRDDEERRGEPVQAGRDHDDEEQVHDARDDRGIDESTVPDSPIVGPRAKRDEDDDLDHDRERDGPRGH